MASYNIFASLVKDPRLPAQVGAVPARLEVDGGKVLVTSSMDAHNVAVSQSAGQAGAFLAGGLLGAAAYGVLRSGEFGGQVEIDPSTSVCLYDPDRRLLTFSLAQGAHVGVVPLRDKFRKSTPEQFDELMQLLRPIFQGRVQQEAINKWHPARKISAALLICFLFVFGSLILLGILFG